MAAKKTRTKSKQVVKSSQPARQDWLTWAILAVLLVVAVFAVFWPTLGGGFVYDDTDYVTDNPNVQHGISAQSLQWAFTAFHSANWHPLTWLSHMLDVRFYGMNPMGHHLTNVILHALNVVLLFWLLWRMTGALWRSAFVAALFGLHPLHVESVAWVAERKDVLSTFFWLLTMAAYVRYAKKPNVARYAAVFACLALGLMAKPMLVSLPIVLLLLDWWPLKRTGWKELVWEKTPLFALSAGSCAVTIAAQRAVGAVVPTDVYPFATRAANALVAYATYLSKALWPARLSAYCPYVAKPAAGQVMLSAAAILAVSVLAFRLARDHRYLAVGWLWYLVTLVPVIGLVQVGGQSMADRYTYVPLIGIFIMLAWGVPELARRVFPSRGAAVRAKVLAAAAGIALVLLSVTAERQTRYWKDAVTLWQHAVAVTDNNDFAEYSLGIALRQRRDFEQAKRHFAESLRIQPNRAQAHAELGSILWAEGNTEEAASEFREALRLDSDCVDAHNNMGTYLASKHEYAEAAQDYRAAIRLRPAFGPAHLNLAAAYYCLGQYNKAWDEVDASVRYGERPAPAFLQDLSSKAPRRQP